MDPPIVPRFRKHRFGSSLPSLVKQYPSSHNGRKEIRMEMKAEDRPVSAAFTSRERPNTNAANASIRLPSHELQTSSSDAINEPLVEDFQDRYDARPTYSEAETNISRRLSVSQAQDVPMSPDISDMDDPIPQPQSRYGTPVSARASSHHSNARPLSKRLPTSRKHSGLPPATPDAPTEHVYGGPGDHSSADSIFSQETSATSINTLPALQTKGPYNGDSQQLVPMIEDDPRSFDLVAPQHEGQHVGMYDLERRAQQLFSHDHLRTIFEDPKLLLRFTGFLNSHRPQSIPLLIYYLDALKALRAISYANAIAEALEPIRGHDFTDHVAKPTMNTALEDKANKAFDVLVGEDLPAYVAHTWIQVVSISIQRRIAGTLAPHLREASEGLAEVFCLSDPSRADNPIVFASEEFARTTQYGMSYTIGRNCRFLQGPGTDQNSVRRLAQACQAGKELTEVVVNYRRDGSPFMNLLMIAPLMDSRGNVRYFIGAQVDVSGLMKDCSDLEGFARLAQRDEDPGAEDVETESKDEFQDLSEMFNGAELETVRKFGGRMHREHLDDGGTESVMSHGRPRLRLKNPSSDALHVRQRDSVANSVTSTVKEKLNGKLEGIYQHYILARPAPSLRILFTSPSLRVPGILQSPFLNRIGGSSRVRSDLAAALGDGRGVTAKIRWLTKADQDGEGDGRPRWIHCTPLLGHNGAVGVWMIVLVDEEGSANGGTGRRFRPAPPVAADIGCKDWEGSGSRSRERKQHNAYDKENERQGGNDRLERDYVPLTWRPSNSRKSSHVASQTELRRPASTRPDSVDASEFSIGIRTPSEHPNPKAGMV